MQICNVLMLNSHITGQYEYKVCLVPVVVQDPQGGGWFLINKSERQTLQH